MHVCASAPDDERIAPHAHAHLQTAALTHARTRAHTHALTYTHTHARTHAQPKSNTRTHTHPQTHTPLVGWRAQKSLFLGGATTDRPAVAGRAHRVDVAVADEDLRRRAARRAGLFVCVLESILAAILKPNRSPQHGATGQTHTQARIRPAERTHARSVCV
jgi:hypothetical protein